MRWRARSIRFAADFPPDGEAALRPIPTLGGPGLGGVELAGAGQVGQTGRTGRTGQISQGKPGPGSSGMSLFSSRSPESGPGSQPNGAAKGNSSAETGRESAQSSQPSVKVGVPEDMATLVLDNSALGVGPGTRPDSRTEPGPGANAGGANAALDPASDAAIMLRVAAGAEAGFNFLVGKYNKAIIHFLFRMVHNEAVAEELAQEVFLRVYRSRESYRAEAKFTTWLYRIATNLAVN